MRIFGHPLHPMLVHFPIALWTIATACDGLALASVGAAWRVAWLALAIGTAAALPAAVAGLLDFARLSDEAAPTGTRHMLLMGSAFCAYAAALALRTSGWGPSPAPALAATGLSALGFVLLIGGGHFGAALVYRFGAGREERQ